MEKKRMEKQPVPSFILREASCMTRLGLWEPNITTEFKEIGILSLML